MGLLAAMVVVASARPMDAPPTPPPAALLSVSFSVSAASFSPSSRISTRTCWLPVLVNRSVPRAAEGAL